MADADPDSSPDLPEELVDRVDDLDDRQIAELVRYAETLLAERTSSITELIRESEDPDRIVSIEEKVGYAAVVRHDTEDGPPILYHVRREHHPDGSIDLHWSLLGQIAD